MSTSEIGSDNYPKCDEVALPPAEAESKPAVPRPLHRLRAVRREQGLTLRRLAQLMKTDVDTLQRPTTADPPAGDPVRRPNQA